MFESYDHIYISETTKYLSSSSMGFAIVLLLLIIGLCIYIHVKSKKPKFDRKSHPVHIPGYANVTDLHQFNPFTINDTQIKNTKIDVYNPDTYKLGDISVPIAFFDGENNHLRADSPGNYPKMVKNLPIEALLTSRFTDNLRLQYISHLYNDGNEIAQYFADTLIGLLKKIKKKYQIHSHEIEDVSIDIHTNPWNTLTRFNCTDRWSVVLHGTKKLLLFNVKRKKKQSIETHLGYVRYILNQLANSSIHRAKDHLDTIGIKTQLVTLHPGDLLFLGGGTFFMESSLEETSHTVTLNMDVSPPPELKKWYTLLFGELWSRPFENLGDYNGLDVLTIR